MAEIKEITANNTTPSIPTFPCVVPLIHAPPAGDGQIWPLESPGTAVVQVLTLQIFGFFADGWLWVAQSLGLFGWLVGWSIGWLFSWFLSRLQVLWGCGRLVVVAGCSILGIIWSVGWLVGQ